MWQNSSPQFLDQFGICFWSLVGGFNHLEKYESQIGSSSQLLGKIKFVFQTTNQVYGSDPEHGCIVLHPRVIECVSVCVSVCENRYHIRYTFDYAGEWWAMMKSPLNEDAPSIAVIWRRDAFVTYLHNLNCWTSCHHFVGYFHSASSFPIRFSFAWRRLRRTGDGKLYIHHLQTKPKQCVRVNSLTCEHRRSASCGSRLLVTGRSGG